jgi:hypothetical protein
VPSTRPIGQFSRDPRERSVSSLLRDVGPIPAAPAEGLPEPLYIVPLPEACCDPDVPDDECCVAPVVPPLGDAVWIGPLLALAPTCWLPGLPGEPVPPLVLPCIDPLVPLP